MSEDLAAAVEGFKRLSHLRDLYRLDRNPSFIPKVMCLPSAHTK